MTDDEIREIAKQGTERRNLELKGKILWDNYKFKLVKSIIAMANLKGGGTILLGIDEDKRDIVGIDTGELKFFHHDRIKPFANDYANPPVDFDIEIKTIDDKFVIEIIVKEFEFTPIICAKQKNPHLYEGDIYIRPNKKIEARKIQKSYEMRELVDLAVDKEILKLEHRIKAIINQPGQNIWEERKDSMEQYKNELQNSKQDAITKIKSYGYWEFSLLPLNYRQNRFRFVSELREIMRNNFVYSHKKRGWPFALYHPYEIKDYDNHISLNYTTNNLIEEWKLFRSGQFIYHRTMWEDINREYLEVGKQPVSISSQEKSPVDLYLEYKYSIQLISEALLFFRRITKKYYSNEDLQIAIILHKCEGRQLFHYKEDKDMNRTYRSLSPNIEFSEDFTYNKIQEDYDKIAKDILKYIFECFQWTQDFTENTIISIQNELYRDIEISPNYTEWM